MRRRRMPGGVRTGELPGPLGPILSLADPKRLILACAQPGHQLNPLVKKRERVVGGQRLAEPNGEGFPIYAPCAGTVTDVAPALSSTGDFVLAIFLENDGSGETAPALPGWDDPTDPTPEAIRLRALEAGIPDVARGGIALARSLAPTTPIQTVVLNGCTTEPLVQAERVLLHHEWETVLFGFRAAIRAIGAPEAIVALSVADRPLVGTLSQSLTERDAITIEILPDRYPQGLERYLLAALRGVDLPVGEDPATVGFAVFDVTTMHALGRALRDGQPFTHRVVTVAGDGVARPGNYRVPLGMPLGALMEAAGRQGTIRQLVWGGPLSGTAVASEEIGVCANTRAVLAYQQPVSFEVPTTDCIRCGRCIDVCPERLSPIYLARYAEHKRWDEAEAEGALLCSSCGACSYVCPTGRPLVQSIQLARYEILRQREAERASQPKEVAVP